MKRLIIQQLLYGCLFFLFFSFQTDAAEYYDHPNKTDLFVDITNVIPSIKLDIRYAGNHNFLGTPVDGYHAPKCYLTTRAARALKSVQASLSAKNMSLKIYDCYRPQRAVNHFVRWAKNIDDQITKQEFYPGIDKRTLFKKGFIASRSGHTRGSTVDLTIVALPLKQQPMFNPVHQIPCYASVSKRYADNSIDMGTGFDCFHVNSATASPHISQTAKQNRKLLKNLMNKAGFENYTKEWWHYTLKNEPYQKSYFDFIVE